MNSLIAFEMLDRDRCLSMALKAYSEAIDNGFISEEGFPLKCDNCFSIELKSVTVDTVESIICEAEIVCESCKVSLGYYAYGITQSKFFPY